MKALGGLLLVGAVVAFLLGYSPSDLMYMWPSGGGSSLPSKSRRTAGTTEEARPSAPAPVQHS
ncbi:MAG TPA: hypothetical protein VJ721_08390, partial [Chthoniobacterales bacterium]|nr:hypothetical protein [Chthoniobacterales bacterium]